MFLFAKQKESIIFKQVTSSLFSKEYIWQITVSSPGKSGEIWMVM